MQVVLDRALRNKHDYDLNNLSKDKELWHIYEIQHNVGDIRQKNNK